MSNLGFPISYKTSAGTSLLLIHVRMKLLNDVRIKQATLSSVVISVDVFSLRVDFNKSFFLVLEGF